MKKVISLLISASLMLALLPVGAYAAFPDMAETHWAYASVEKLVNSGTINGMPDGTFSPAGVVSRAEFVKMLGKSTKKFEKNFADVPETHWAYDYIMYSELEGDENGNFNPSATITRGEVANLLYKRYGNGNTALAPYYITSQGTNKNAVAWVYATGLMMGGDKINLRLDDTLTRAEAAVLIVRTQELEPGKINGFIDNFPDEVYKNVYEGSNIFDTPYESQGTITREELSAAAMRFQYKYRTPAIRYYYEAKYDGDYAKYWDIACNYALDEKNFGSTKESASKNAKVDEALAILTLGAKNNIYVASNFDDVETTVYNGVTIKDSASKYADKMTYAYNFGISLDSDYTMSSTRDITKKEVACILMQYSLTFGSQIGYHCGLESGYIPLSACFYDEYYPENRAFYGQVAEGIPGFVYSTPYKMTAEVSIEPKDFVDTTAMIAYTYATAFMYICEEAYEKGAEIYIDFYPTLTMRLADMNEIYRVKFSVSKDFDGMKLSDVFNLGEGVEDRTLKAGDSFWCDISSNQSTVGKLYIDYTLMTVDQIIG